MASRFPYCIYKIRWLPLGWRFLPLQLLEEYMWVGPLWFVDAFGDRPLGSSAAALRCQASDLFRFWSVSPARCLFLTTPWPRIHVAIVIGNLSSWHIYVFTRQSCLTCLGPAVGGHVLRLFLLIQPLISVASWSGGLRGPWAQLVLLIPLFYHTPTGRPHPARQLCSCPSTFLLVVDWSRVSPFYRFLQLTHSCKWAVCPCFFVLCTFLLLYHVLSSMLEPLLIVCVPTLVLIVMGFIFGCCYIYMGVEFCYYYKVYWVSDVVHYTCCSGFRILCFYFSYLLPFLGFS